MRWSVGFEAECGQLLSIEQVVELADAVAGHSGIASGMGSTQYGARFIVEAESRYDAIERGTEIFTAAAGTARLPAGEIVHTEAVSEDEDA